MKISVDEIPQSPKEIHFSESVEDLNRIYSQSKNREFGFPAVLEVDLTYYRSGQDIFFTADSTRSSAVAAVDAWRPIILRWTNILISC